MIGKLVKYISVTFKRYGWKLENALILALLIFNIFVGWLLRASMLSCRWRRTNILTNLILYRHRK